MRTYMGGEEKDYLNSCHSCKEIISLILGGYYPGVRVLASVIFYDYRTILSDGDTPETRISDDILRVAPVENRTGGSSVGPCGTFLRTRISIS
jgi:hypothetical protein